MDKVRRITKGKIPTDVTHWLRELIGVRRFLTQVDMYAEAYGEEWTQNQKAYYNDRLADLCAFPPQGVTVMGNKITYELQQ